MKKKVLAFMLAAMMTAGLTAWSALAAAMAAAVWPVQTVLLQHPGNLKRRIQAVQKLRMRR